jgi:hypothetical protein
VVDFNLYAFRQLPTDSIICPTSRAINPFQLPVFLTAGEVYHEDIEIFADLPVANFHSRLILKGAYRLITPLFGLFIRQGFSSLLIAVNKGYEVPPGLRCQLVIPREVSAKIVSEGSIGSKYLSLVHRVTFW